MIKPLNFILILVGLWLWSCKEQIKNDQVVSSEAHVLPQLSVDHLNIWVDNPKEAQEKLKSLGFYTVPDSLSNVHSGQGTAGKYFHFLNGYLELIYVNDDIELVKNNAVNKDLDFTIRANHKQNGASPFSIALRLEDYKVDNIPFAKVSYHQDWMVDDMYIYAAKNSKINVKEPSVFVVYPKIESEQFNAIDDVENIPDQYAFSRAFYKHPNKVKKITKIVIESTDLNLDSETMKAVNAIPNIEVITGENHVMELYFDNNVQKKSFDLRPELPLIVYL